MANHDEALVHVEASVCKVHITSHSSLALELVGQCTLRSFMLRATRAIVQEINPTIPKNQNLHKTSAPGLFQ